MQVLLDTNVILDLFLEREPFVDDAALIWKAHEAGRLTAYVSAISPVNLFYIGRKLKGRKAAEDAVRELLMVLPVAVVNQSVLEAGLQLKFKDYEDAVQLASAVASGLDTIITRNEADFEGATLDVVRPATFIKLHTRLFEELELDSGESGQRVSR